MCSGIGSGRPPQHRYRYKAGNKQSPACWCNPTSKLWWTHKHGVTQFSVFCITKTSGGIIAEAGRRHASGY